MSQPARRPTSAAPMTPTAMPALAPVDKPDELTAAVTGADVVGLSVADAAAGSDAAVVVFGLAVADVELVEEELVLLDAVMLK